MTKQIQFKLDEYCDLVYLIQLGDVECGQLETTSIWQVSMVDGDREYGAISVESSCRGIQAGVYAGILIVMCGPGSARLGLTRA